MLTNICLGVISDLPARPTLTKPGVEPQSLCTLQPPVIENGSTRITSSYNQYQYTSFFYILVRGLIPSLIDIHVSTKFLDSLLDVYPCQIYMEQADTLHITQLLIETISCGYLDCTNPALLDLEA